MSEHELPERQPSPERKSGFPVIGDVVVTTHFPLGVVMSTHYPEGINAAAIHTHDDGSESLGLPGTINISEVLSIEGRWDVDRISAAWGKTWEDMGLELSPEKKLEFRSELLADIALDAEQRPADQ